MHFFNRKKKDAVPSRLHSSPSLPNLLNRPTPAQRSPTALRSHLGPLDLAPSKLHPSATPPASPLHLSSLSLSPASSPRRNVLPLTPPLTPSSSLDGGLGLPATPVDEPRSRAVVRDKQGRLVVSLDEDLLREDGFLDDIPTPKERPYEAFYRSKSRAPVENSAPEGTSIVHYIDRDTPPSRFLLIANLPESRSALDHLLGEKTHSLVKGLWAGQLSTCGVVILAFFDVRAAERARYLWNGSDFLETENDGRRGESRRTLRAGWVSLSEAKDLTGNTYPSPITEIEEEAAFYVHLQDFVPGEGTDGGSRDMASRRERVESLMNSFGALLAFTSCGQADSGEWIYVEFFDIRNTQSALENLSGAPILRELRLTLSPAKTSELTSLTIPQMISFAPDSNDDAESSHRGVDAQRGRGDSQSDSRRSSGRRSASAGPGDGVKAFTGPPASATPSLSTAVTPTADETRGVREMEERLRMRLAPSERGRSLSFDGREALQAEARHEEQPHQDRYSNDGGYLDYDGGYGGYHQGPQDFRGYGYGYAADYSYQPGYEHDVYGPCFAPSSQPYPGPQYTTPAPHMISPPRRAFIGSPTSTEQYTPSSPYPIEARRMPRPRRAARMSPISRSAVSPSAMSVASRTTASTASSQPMSPHAAYSSPSSTSRSSRSTHLSHTSSQDGSSSSSAMENSLNLERIERGLDMRTTVMIKNIPNKMSDRDLMTYISKVVDKRIDFFYLRMDFQNGCNVGYAFVNFINVRDLLTFAQARLGVKWNMYSSEKVLQMSYANYQGKEALVEKFKNSGIMDEREAWRPKIFYSSGEKQGFPEPFPEPTHQRRKERSAHNRGALFVPGVARAR